MVVAAELFGVPEYEPLTRTSLLDGVTVSLGAYGGAPTNTGSVLGLNDSRITFLGGDKVKWGTTFPQYNVFTTKNLTTSTGARTGIGGRLAFETDAQSFDLKLYCGSGVKLSLVIDGVPVANSVISTPADGSIRYLTVDLSEAGLTPGYHSVEIEFNAGADYAGLVLQPGANIRPFEEAGPRIVGLGDSITEGTGSAGPHADFVSIVGRNLGTSDIWQSGSGGTGYATANGTRPALVGHIQADGVNADGDIYVVAMGVNDAPGIYDEVVATLTALTQGRPDAKIFVVGGWNYNGPDVSAKAHIYAEIAAAVATFPSVVFLDSSGVTYPRFDTVHPTSVGQWIMGEWLTAQIRAHMGVDGVVEQNVSGDVVGPVYLKDRNAAETLTFEVRENGITSTRFEIVDTGDAWPILKLQNGVAIGTVGSVSVELVVTGNMGTSVTTQIDFDVRQHFAGGAASETFSGTGEGVSIDAGKGNDTLNGTAGDDVLIGGEGNDTLDGRGGADRMVGSSGNDRYIVDSIADAVEESTNQGTDTVFSTVEGYVLPSNVENLELGELVAAASGNSLNNRLIGNAFANTLYGQGGNDYLDGMGGADRLLGGAGDDIYVVDDVNDVLTEKASGGTDEVRSTVSFTLGANLERLALMGSDPINATGNSLVNALKGNSGDNALYSLGDNDVIYGYGGNDILDGGAGQDAMLGGSGDDTYYVDNINDRVYETETSGISSVADMGGIDTVFTSVSYSIEDSKHGRQFIENMTLLGSAGLSLTGNSRDNVLTGNGGANVIRAGIGNDSLIGGGGNDQLYGEGGNDTLDGGTGIDRMFGGEGDDIYYVESSGDTVFETATSAASDVSDLGGYDIVRSTINYSIASSNPGRQFVESIELIGNAAVNARGNELDNVLVGNSANNTLIGGAGADTMTGGGGADNFLFDALDLGRMGSPDIITDFTTTQGDKISLSAIDADIGTPADDAFSFIGAVSFGNIAGQLRAEQHALYVLVEGDLDGDGVADFTIQLDGTMALSASAFLL